LNSPWTAAQVVQICNLLNGIALTVDEDVTSGMSTKPGTMLASGLDSAPVIRRLMTVAVRGSFDRIHGSSLRSFLSGVTGFSPAS